jgi:glyoxylase-like metal-dependent hydrolase (beta-lactamase superfamily II)
MDAPLHKDLVDNVTCIDTGYYRPSLAACYLIVHKDQAAFVDTGTFYAVPSLLKLLDYKNIAVENVAYVMPTHVHLDHAGGAGELMRHLPNATLISHPRGARHLIDPGKLTASATAIYGENEFRKSFGEIVPVPEQRIIVADDGFGIDLNGRPFLFLDTPGHARHHYSVYDEMSNGFFTGDTFGLSYRELDSINGSYIFPTATPVQFDPEAWHTSIDRYLSYKPERMFLTHFGMVTDISRLADNLHRGIDAFVDMAHQASNSDNRHQKILENMTEYLISGVASVNPEIGENRCKEIFALDLALNTQGLEVWLDRISPPPPIAAGR